jgi:integrase
MPLTPVAIKNAKSRTTPFKLADGGGLFVLVQPNGSKLWRLKYRFMAKEKLLSIGPFPVVSLVDARLKRDEAKRLLAKGSDPSVQKRLDDIAVRTAANCTFGLVAEEYLNNLAAQDAAASTIKKNRWLLINLASAISERPIAEITSAELLDMLKQIEKSDRRESARRLRGVMSSVFKLAIVTLRASNDPTLALQGALLRPKVSPRAAIIDEKQFGALLVAVDQFNGWPTIKAALKILSLTFCRPGEVRGMKRSEVDLEKAVWKISAERTKMRRPHEVPLSQQAVAVLKEIWPFSEGGEFVFASIPSKHKMLSDGAFISVLRRMGYTKEEVSPHGFRSSASTILNERNFSPDVIEAALGHQDKNAIRRTYNRASHWQERVSLMQKWADLLDEFKGIKTN